MSISSLRIVILFIPNPILFPRGTRNSRRGDATMSSEAHIRRPHDVVLQIPELMDGILTYLSSRDRVSLHLVCKSMHQHCYRWFRLVLDSTREFDDDENDDDECTATVLAKPHQEQENQPFIILENTRQQNLLHLRRKRHEQGILTQTGQRMLKARVDLIQALDLELDSNSTGWNRRLLKEALILGSGKQQSTEG